MGESRNMDSSYRIKEINSAREKINAKPYLQGDAKIKEAIKYGICTNLVLNDPEYEITLSELKEAERERIRKEREAKKAAEINYERSRILFASRWTEKNKDYLAALNFRPRFEGVYYDNIREHLGVYYTCSGADGLVLALEIIFKNGKRILDEDSFSGECYSGKNEGVFYNLGFTTPLGEHLHFNRRDLKSIISEVNLYVSGIASGGSKKHGIPKTNRSLYLWEPQHQENREIYKKTLHSEYPFKHQIFRN